MSGRVKTINARGEITTQQTPLEEDTTRHDTPRCVPTKLELGTGAILQGERGAVRKGSLMLAMHAAGMVLSHAA